MQVIKLQDAICMALYDVIDRKLQLTDVGRVVAKAVAMKTHSRSR
jgi:hypothetical protein